MPDDKPLNPPQLFPTFESVSDGVPIAMALVEGLLDNEHDKRCVADAYHQDRADTDHLSNSDFLKRLPELMAHDLYSNLLLTIKRREARIKAQQADRATRPPL